MTAGAHLEFHPIHFPLREGFFGDWKFHHGLSSSGDHCLALHTPDLAQRPEEVEVPDALYHCPSYGVRDRACEVMLELAEPWDYGSEGMVWGLWLRRYGMAMAGCSAF